MVNILNKKQIQQVQELKLIDNFILDYFFNQTIARLCVCFNDVGWGNHYLYNKVDRTQFLTATFAAS